MNCPRCAKEMEQGYLGGDSPLVWTRNPEKISRFAFKGEVYVRDFLSFLDGEKKHAYLCRGCRTLVIDY